MLLLRVVFSCCLCMSVGWCFVLDSLYQLAQPGEGYDRLLALDSFQIYEGGFIAESNKKTRINGFGAIIDLSGATIHQITAEGEGTLLDIERCVIINSGDSLAALDYSDSASGTLDHLAMVNNFDGVRFWRGETLTMKNSIIVSSIHYGVMTDDSSMTSVVMSFNDCWNNQSGNYMCWFGSC